MLEKIRAASSSKIGRRAHPSLSLSLCLVVTLPLLPADRLAIFHRIIIGRSDDDSTALSPRLLFLSIRRRSLFLSLRFLSSTETGPISSSSAHDFFFFFSFFLSIIFSLDYSLCWPFLLIWNFSSFHFRTIVALLASIILIDGASTAFNSPPLIVIYRCGWPVPSRGRVEK